jgi:hypothetical protein
VVRAGVVRSAALTGAVGATGWWAARVAAARIERDEGIIRRILDNAAALSGDWYQPEILEKRWAEEQQCQAWQW